MGNSLNIPQRRKNRAVPKNCNEYIPLPQFAKEVNYSERAVSRWITKRNVEAFKLRGRWYIRRGPWPLRN